MHSALHIRFSGAAEGEKFFLPMNVGFGRNDFSLLACGSRGMGRFNRKREIGFCLRHVGLIDLAGSDSFFLFQHLFFGADQARVREIELQPDRAQLTLLGFHFGERTDFPKPFGAGGISFRAFDRFLKFGKIDILRERRRRFCNRGSLALLNEAINAQHTYLKTVPRNKFGWFMLANQYQSLADSYRRQGETAKSAETATKTAETSGAGDPANRATNSATGRAANTAQSSADHGLVWRLDCIYSANLGLSHRGLLHVLRGRAHH